MKRASVIKITALLVLLFAFLLVIRKVDTSLDPSRAGAGYGRSDVQHHSEYRSASRVITRKAQRRPIDESYVMRVAPVSGYLDPSEGFFEAWLEIQAVEADAEHLSFDEKLEGLTKAYGIYKGLSKEHTDWKAHLVDARLESTRLSLLKLIKSTEQVAASDR